MRKNQQYQYLQYSKNPGWRQEYATPRRRRAVLISLRNVYPEIQQFHPHLIIAKDRFRSWLVKALVKATVLWTLSNILIIIYHLIYYNTNMYLFSCINRKIVNLRKNN